MSFTARQALADRDERRAADDQAWRAYVEACHDPLATDEQRAALFQTALSTSAATGWRS